MKLYNNIRSVTDSQYTAVLQCLELPVDQKKELTIPRYT